MSLRQLQDILGHSCPKTTARYTHLTGVIEQGDANALDTLIDDLIDGGQS